MSEFETTNQERTTVTVGGKSFYTDALTEQDIKQLNTADELSKAMNALTSAVLVVTNLKNISTLAAMGLETFISQTADSLNTEAQVPNTEDQATVVN